MEKLNFIVCCDKNYGIAKEGKIPWSFKYDMEWFKNITINNIIIMGSKTWLSISKILPRRHNIIVSKNMDML